jgi:thioredoxin reductase
MTERIDVAIIGSGPAGISAALELRKLGVRRVVILERERDAGGVPRHCAHPPYGFWEFGRIMTGPAYARRLVALAEQADVDIRTLNTVVNLLPGGILDIATPNGRAQLCPRRVLIATGVRETPRSARLISGERPLGILNTGALQAYIHLHGMLPFQRPVIVGTELVALSAVADCRSHGVRPVAMFEKNSRATARWPLNLFPRLLGIPVRYNSEVVAIKGTPRVTSVLVRGPEGEGLQEVSCDGVLLTGGFVPEASLIRGSHLVLDPASQGPAIDQFGRCSDPSYFAAGNVLRPVETAGWCFREGRRIARYVVDDLAGALPTGQGEGEIVCGDGVKFVVPQRLAQAVGKAGAEHLEIRVPCAIKGKLRVLADARVIFEKAISALPERRILIPLRVVAAQRGVRRFVVEIKP